MMQSQDADYEDDQEQDDETCDCPVCQKARKEAEEKDAVQEVAIDRISDTEWQICDFASDVNPKTYLLLMQPVNGNVYANMNFLLVECDCDNFDNAFEEYQVFEREIWSADMYIADARVYEEFAEYLLDRMLSVNLSNPIELAYEFGGKVHHRNVIMPPAPYVM